MRTVKVPKFRVDDLLRKGFSERVRLNVLFQRRVRGVVDFMAELASGDTTVTGEGKTPSEAVAEALRPLLSS